MQGKTVFRLVTHRYIMTHGEGATPPPPGRLRRLRCFGDASWQTLKQLCAQYRPRRRPSRPQRPKQNRAVVSQQPIRSSPRVVPLAEGANAWDPPDRRPPARPRWDLVRTEADWWGDLDRDAERRLQGWRRGEP